MTGVWYCTNCGPVPMRYTKNGVYCSKCGKKAVKAQKTSIPKKQVQHQMLFNKESRMIQIRNFPIQCPNCHHPIGVSMDFSLPPELQQDLYKYQIYVNTLIGIGMFFDWEEFHCSPDREHKKAFDRLRFWAEERLRDTPRDFLTKEEKT